MDRFAALVLLLTPLACAGATPQAPRPPACEPEEPHEGDLLTSTLDVAELRGQALEDELRRVTLEVAELRGLEPVAVGIELRDADAYDREEEENRAGLEERSRHLPADRRRSAETDISTDTKAHYHIERNVIVLRVGEDTPTGKLIASTAHETVHALQHAHLVLGRSFPSHDRYLARRALTEGDAKLTAMLYIGARRGVAPSRLLAQMTDPARIEALEDVSSFPYVAGLAFAAALYQVGGFAAIDRAFASPPESTEQILHPQRFLDDDAPVYVVFPVLGNHHSVDEGTRGELGTRRWLERCADACDGCGRGWGGDAYRTLVGEADRPLHLWSTVWDDIASARRFARQARRCGVDVTSRGLQVFVAEGQDARDRREGLRAMAAAPQPRPRPRHPRGGTVPARRPPGRASAACP